MLDNYKLKEFSDDNFTFNENGRMFSKRLENTYGKGEIDLISNFSFFHSVFKGHLLHTCKNQGLFEKGSRGHLLRGYQNIEPYNYPSRQCNQGSSKQQEAH